MTLTQQQKWTLKYGFFSAVTMLLIALFYSGYLYARDPEDNLQSGHYWMAHQQYQKMAQSGEASAANVVGNLYYLGLGVERDFALAAHWYLKAALEGFVPAQINMGKLYWNGLGVPRKALNAAGWFHLARRTGSERAEGFLAYMIQANDVLPNIIEAAKERFETIAVVKNRYENLGETSFLRE